MPVSFIAFEAYGKCLLLTRLEMVAGINPGYCPTIEQNREEIIRHLHDIILLVTY